MQILTHNLPNQKIAELVSDEILIHSASDGADLLADLYYQEFDKIILYEKNITPAFFDLKTGMAGEILQKFSNFRMQLAIVGTFENYTGKSFLDFVSESNKGGNIQFAGNIKDVLM